MVAVEPVAEVAQADFVLEQDFLLPPELLTQLQLVQVVLEG